MTQATRAAPKPRKYADTYLDGLYHAEIKALPPGASYPVFVRDEVVAAHYRVPVNTFVLLPADEALYMLQQRFGYSAHGPNIAAGDYHEHKDDNPFLPFSEWTPPTPPAPEPAPTPPAPEPPPEPAPAPPATRGARATK